MRRLCVVFDTNALWGDLRLTGIAWQVLAVATAGDLTHLRFPSTVLDEAMAKYGEGTDAEARQLADQTLKHLADAAVLTPVQDALTAAKADFEDYRQCQPVHQRTMSKP